jgi:hypothetical protein
VRDAIDHQQLFVRGPVTKLQELYDTFDVVEAPVASFEVVPPFRFSCQLAFDAQSYPVYLGADVAGQRPAQNAETQRVECAAETVAAGDRSGDQFFCPPMRGLPP